MNRFLFWRIFAPNFLFRHKTTFGVISGEKSFDLVLIVH